MDYLGIDACWIAVYVLCRNALIKSHSSHHDMYVHCYALSICQLPNCNLFTQHAISYWRDTTSELWTPVHSFTSNTIYCNTCSLLFFAYKHHLPHYTFNPLLQQAGEIDNLTVKLGQSSLIVLCRFHVGAGITGVAPHYTSPPSTFNVLLDSYWFNNLGFLLREKLSAVRITPSSWGSQRTCASRVSRLFSGAVAGDLKKSYTTEISNSHVNFPPATVFWRRCRGDQDTLQGESSTSNLFTLFLSCFTLFYLLLCLFSISKIQKN